jgi:hypothetical protein
MKIYIDWDRAEWYTEEEQFFEGLVEDGNLKTYSDFLADEYADCLDELLDLSEKEKEELYEKYKIDLKLEFEEKVKYNQLNYTVLNVETKDIVAIKEIL